MKLRSFALALILCVAATGCSDELLVENPNAPTPAALTSEEGLRRQARGIHSALYDGGFFPWIVAQYHDGMGDQLPSNVGNYYFVDVVNPAEIRFSNGVVQNPPAVRGGPPQQEILNIVNARTVSDPVLFYEWRAAYRTNAEANLLLQAAENPAVQWTGDAAGKKQAYAAWAHFWKGYAYSRIGLLYEQGIITDVYGGTNNDFKSSAEMLAESNRQFDLAIQNAGAFDQIATTVVPDLFVSKPTSASLVQAANTMKARNLLAGKYRDQMTAADWQQLEALTAAGLTTNANAVQWRFDQTTFAGTGSVLYRSGALGPTWSYISMRQVQEYYEGDNRIQRAGEDKPGASVVISTPFVHSLNRGWNAVTSARGREPVFETTVGAGIFHLISAEENLLMAAEAKLALSKPGEAATLVDQVRTMQNAGLPALTAATVDFEVIRRERRVALLARGLAYYDARRLRISTPGGGRENAWVYRQDGSNWILDQEAEIDYDFRPYWPVPVHELTFNPPAGAGQPN